MKVLVIGGTGFIGYHIVKRLVASGHRAGIMALPPAPAGLLLPPDVEIHLQDMAAVGDAELLQLLKPYDSFVFAAGADDRTVPPRPAWPFFEMANVIPVERLVRLAGEAGMTAGVVMGSYFTFFNRTRPEMKLAVRHPYIRSRLEQQTRGFAAAKPGFRLMFLELPFIFGAIPGKKPLWTPLVNYLHSGFPVVCPRGGTAVVAVTSVAEAAVEALERGEGGGLYPIAAANLGWEELFRRLMPAGYAVRRVYRLPGSVLGATLVLVHWLNRITGRESGLDMRRLSRLLLSELYLETGVMQSGAGAPEKELDSAFGETISAIRR